MKRFVIRVLTALAPVAAACSGLFVTGPAMRPGIANAMPGIFNAGPPPIAKGVITKEDWRQWKAASDRLTGVLRAQFPAGSREEVLKSILAGQGFRPVDPQPSNCLPPGQQAPAGVIYHQCLTPEQEERRKRTLVYQWGGGVCTETIAVSWWSDDHGALSRVDGNYYNTCL